ncbi:MAG: cytochrome c-type biogenesis protein CcmH [Acidobacteriota bacterium]|nr:cytochrome c-type biogenesis protein CcmH [Acidobacteriota bacterium]
MKRVALQLLLLFSLAATGVAQTAQPLAEDPEIEKRLQALSQELRCLVCQNESLADSRAGLAEDLRREIRDQMKAGKSDKEIIAFLTARYGDFVLYRPRVTPTTYLLWFGPFILLAVGLLVLYQQLKLRRKQITQHPLTEQDRRRLDELLAASNDKEPA